MLSILQDVNSGSGSGGFFSLDGMRRTAAKASQADAELRAAKRRKLEKETKKSAKARAKSRR
jgi:hypothetical protein